MQIHYLEELQRLGEKYSVSFDYKEKPIDAEGSVCLIHVKLDRMLASDKRDSLHSELLARARSLFQ